MDSRFWKGGVFDNLTRITIPEGVETIGEHAFQGCKNLEEMVLPDSLRNIEQNAFLNCSNLKEFSTEGSITIGNQAFSGCSSLEKVHAKAITEIQVFAFNNCTSLKEIDYINATEIGYGAFQNCTGLTKAVISAALKEVKQNAFGTCQDTLEIHFYGTKQQFSQINVQKNNDPFKNARVIYYSDIPLEGISLNKKELILTVGTEEKLEVIYDPEYTSDDKEVIWESDHPEIADVRSDGTVVPLKPGETIITATSVVSSEYTAECKVRVQFSDVTDPNQFYYEYIYWMADEGITTGYSDGTYGLYKECNRAAVVTFLWRLAGKPEPKKTAKFSDMTGNADFDKAISWASEEGITTGWEDNTFRPWNTCNRAAIMTFLWRYAGKPEVKVSEAFSDMTGNADFDKAISWGVENGITTGYTDGTFRPWNICNRLAIASFLGRYEDLKK